MRSKEPMPTCPDCGSPMAQRTARKGRNAGRPFWGCSHYPACKGTLDIGETNAVGVSGGPAAPPAPIKPALTPIPWAGPRLEDGTRTHFLSGGGRPGIEDDALAGIVTPVVVGNLSNWCLLTRTEQAPVRQRRPTAVNQALTVARKILTRGRRPVVSGTVELEIVASAEIPFAIESPAQAPEIFFEVSQRQYRRTLRDELALAAQAPSYAVIRPRDWALDSYDEEQFITDVFPRLLGPEAMAYLHPQVSFSNLLGPEANGFTNARVDFLFSPPGAAPLVIEIDGAQHQETTAADAERDRVLRAAGYKVMRLSSTDVRRGEGPAYAELEQTWDRRTGPDRPPANWAVTLLWAPALVVRTQLAVLHALEQGILTPGADAWTIRMVERDVSGGITALKDLHDLLKQIERVYGCELLPLTLYVECLSSDGNLTHVCLGRDILADGGGQDEQLDLDLSVRHSYIGALDPVPAEVMPNWGSFVLFEVRVANIPALVAPPACVAPPATLSPPALESLTFFLHYLFRKRQFRDGQAEAIGRTMAGLDSIVLLPTGAGKSLIYQLAGLLLPGVTMIVDPIISLIEDQLYNLQRYGIDRAIGISSLIEDPQGRQQALTAFGRGDFFFCYLAPERLQTPQFREQCRSVVTFSAFNLWAIDEAHCVSEWGHDFRTAYLNLGRVARDLGRSGDFVPPIAALTGTASRAVLRDVQRELAITAIDAMITPRNFDRPELHFEVVTAPTHQKSAALSGAVQGLMHAWGMDAPSFFSPNGRSTMGGLVFCPHVNGEHGIVQVAQVLRSTFHTEVRIYSGSAPKGTNPREWSREKSENALRFKENDVSLLACTKAFGMGIDKPNIRYTIHYGIPGSLESFYQEAGRAGRDRQPAYNIVVFSNDQVEKAKAMLDPDLSLEQVRAMREGGRGQEDDVGRMLFFHLESFAGVEEELATTVDALARFGPVGEKSPRKCSFEDDRERSSLEKAIHRLHLMGIVEDYTLDYSRRQFEMQVYPPTRSRITEALIHYVQGYNIQKTRWMQQTLAQGPADDAEFARYSARVLIEFVYDVIERARRTALREMWQVAAECRSDAEIRSRLLEYLQETKFTQAVDEVVASGALDTGALGALIHQIAVPSDAGDLRGSTIRLLESQPDHPALLVLRGVLEVIIRPDAQQDLYQFVTAGLRSLEKRFAANRAEVLQAKAWLVNDVSGVIPHSRRLLAEACVERDVDCARSILVEHTDPELTEPAARALMSRLATQLEGLAETVL